MSTIPNLESASQAPPTAPGLAPNRTSPPTVAKYQQTRHPARRPSHRVTSSPCSLTRPWEGSCQAPILLVGLQGQDSQYGVGRRDELGTEFPRGAPVVNITRDGVVRPSAGSADGFVGRRF